MADNNDLSTAVPFSFFVSLLREISRIRPRQANSFSGNKSRPNLPLKVLQKWISELRAQYSPLPPRTCAIVFRLLFPEEDTRRRYGLKETTLAHHLSDSLGIPERRLRCWNSEDSSGCLGDQVAIVLDRSYAYPDDAIGPLTLCEIDELLDELASLSAYSHPTVRNQYASLTHRSRNIILSSMYRSLPPFDAACLTQIILKDLRPVIHPLPDTHYTVALKGFKSNAVSLITKEEAMTAWDPTGSMRKIYRVRSSLDEAAEAFEQEAGHYVVPKIGTPIEIPKSVKGTGCAEALKYCKHSSTIYAETKYDGERAQIHVQIHVDNSSHITIFSKSKRDSTHDRFAIHSTIREALGLEDKENCKTISNKVKKNVVLEAEMIAFHGDEIDEFWRIRGLIENTARGIRGARRNIPVVPTTESQLDLCSQSSLVTDMSDTRHLGLVFFDILFLDDVSLLSSPYSSRRSILEAVVEPISGRSMLAERTAISLTKGLAEAEHSLRGIFSRLIADHREGLVLKTAESRYNDFKAPWVKLKKDYIPGYGDTVDLVLLGATWDKERARMLRVAPTVLTTFYIGALKNAEDIKRDASVLPHFFIYFTASWGMSREYLEETNFLIKTSDSINLKGSRSSPVDLSYTYTLFSGIPPPMVLLRKPLLVELFGAGFTKSPKSKYYELRFPRINKIYRCGERDWKDGINLEDLHKIGRESVGRDRSNKDLDDWCNNLWGNPVSPGVKCPQKRKAATAIWEHKLSMWDQRSSKKRKIMSQNVTPSPPSRAKAASKTDNQLNLQQPIFDPQPLGTRTNLDFDTPVCHKIEDIKTKPQRQTCSESIDTITNFACPANSTVKPTSNRLSENSSHDLSDHPTMIGDTFVHGADVTLSELLTDAFVWFAKPRRGVAQPQMASLYGAVSSEQRLHSLESLLFGCGWHPDELVGCDWIRRGVIFVDDSDVAGKQWKRYTLEKLKDRKDIISKEKKVEGFGGKPIWVLDCRTLSVDPESQGEVN